MNVVNWVSNESLERMVIEMGNKFWKDFQFEEENDALLSEDLKKEMKQFESDENIPQSSRESTKRCMNNFKKWKKLE